MGWLTDVRYAELVRSVRKQFPVEAEGRVSSDGDFWRQVARLVNDYCVSNGSRGETMALVMEKLAKDLDIPLPVLQRAMTAPTVTSELSTEPPFSDPSEAQTIPNGQDSSFPQMELFVSDAPAAARKKAGKAIGKELTGLVKQKKVSRKIVVELKSVRGELNIFRVLKAPKPFLKEKTLLVECGFGVERFIPCLKPSNFKPGDYIQVTMGKIPVLRKIKSTVAQLGRFTYVARCHEFTSLQDIHLTIELGFGATLDVTVGLRGLNPEGLSLPKQTQLKEFVAKILKIAKVLVVKFQRVDRTGSLNVDIYYALKASDPTEVCRSGSYLNEELIKLAL